ncbi:MAG: hypothetical protein ACFCU6_09240 [Balneolaceae bacterium]
MTYTLVPQAVSLAQHSPDTTVSGLRGGRQTGRLKACSRQVSFHD